ncbi:MAG: SDR family oxidoreductase [Treponema sp.]|nr:SDR family oxidoreductase [Treponema sp.]
MSFNPCDLSGKKIFVTGASSGIGRATAIYISKLGAKVVLTGRNKERLEQTLSMLEGEGHSYVSFDLTDLDNIENIFMESVKDGVKLSGMVHSAGIPFVMPLRSLTPTALQECFKNDFFCFVELVRQYSKTKYCDGGSIVAISSVTSVKPVAGEVGYSTAKAALNNAVLSMATELSKKNIRINGVLAGNILTEMAERTLEQYGNRELKDNEVKQSLIGRWGTLEEVASACAYLLSDMSSFTTAHLLDVSGGLK